VQNLTLYACSPTPISYKGDKILSLSRLVFEISRGTDRQTTNDRCGDRDRKLSHCKYL